MLFCKFPAIFEKCGDVRGTIGQHCHMQMFAWQQFETQSNETYTSWKYLEILDSGMLASRFTPVENEYCNPRLPNVMKEPEHNEVR